MLQDEDTASGAETGRFTRRRLIGYLIAAPTLAAGARWIGPEDAEALVPSGGITDVADLGDVFVLATAPTMGLITVEITPEGGARLQLPRAEVGQGLTTSMGMIVADELDLPLDRVEVTLAPARPALLFNQLTGGSSSTVTLYEPLRAAAGLARARLLLAGGGARTEDGAVITATGQRIPYAQLAAKAAVTKTTQAKVELRPAQALKLTGTEVKRVDARAAVTGRKVFAMDVEVPDAIPAMICRAPTINARALAIENRAAVLAMPGVEHVSIVPKSEYVQGGVAVCARTFGQCIDAIRALKVRWSPGRVDGKSDASVKRDLKRALLPLPPAGLLTKKIEHDFVFHFRPGDALETNSAVADVRPDRAEIWSSMKSPIHAAQGIALMLGLPPGRVTAHVVEGGGSFGRRLFADAAFEAAAVSKAAGRPVRLQWHRTDSFRHGRVHPMAVNRTRMLLAGREVVAFTQRHASVQTDYTHGLGDLLTSLAVKIPLINTLGFSSFLFYLSLSDSYHVGLGQPLLSEIYDYDTFNTSSTRNVYMPDTTTAREVVLDKVARELRRDPLDLRIALARDARMKAVLQRVKQESGWGSPLPQGFGRGVGAHSEYKGHVACVAEIDCRPETVNRKIRDALTGPRVTKLTYVVDVGKAINPLGVKAQIMGGALDGVANALTFSLHLQDGHFLEGSWDNAFYTRQWNTPPQLDVIVVPDTTGEPGGVGELGVAAAMAATANAYWAATGQMPTEFPILHHRADLGFVPQTTIPPLPPQKSDGLAEAGVRS